MTNQSAAQQRALVVEDAVEIQEVVTALLREEGFDVRTASDGERAVEMARAFVPDLIVLDLSLPGLDGISVCQQIRTFSEAYILILTAKSDEVDKVVGLSVGADDYVTKPFSPRELVARVRVLFRRSRAQGPATPAAAVERTFGDLVSDPDAREGTGPGNQFAYSKSHSTQLPPPPHLQIQGVVVQVGNRLDNQTRAWIK